MAITEAFIKTLLYEEESTILDFKQEQYRFIKASDDEKSELLKDILAFCNAWRRADAYILIGVKEVKGGKSIIHGINQLLDDAQLQQFINKKTQRPVDFSYQNMLIEGQQIAVIHIPLQTRPIYLKKDFGKLKQHVVYIRRGSSTDEATPDEIALMGKDVVSQESLCPIIKFNFANTEEQSLLSNPIELESIVLNVPKPQDIPDYEDKYMLKSFSFSNEKYRGFYRKLVAYYEIMGKVNPVNFAITNEGEVVGYDVKVKIDIPDPHQMFVVLDEYNIPNRPISNQIAEMANTTYLPFNYSSADEKELQTYQVKDHHFIEVTVGKIQPKDTIWIKSKLFVGAIKPSELVMNALIYADNLPEPISSTLKIIIKVEEKNASLEDILTIDRQRSLEKYMSR